MCLVTCNKVDGQAPLTGEFVFRVGPFKISIPSCFDIFRNVATKMAAKTVTWLIDQLNTCAARDGGLISDISCFYSLELPKVEI